MDRDNKMPTNLFDSLDMRGSAMKRAFEPRPIRNTRLFELGLSSAEKQQRSLAANEDVFTTQHLPFGTHNEPMAQASYFSQLHRPRDTESDANGGVAVHQTDQDTAAGERLGHQVEV